MRKIFLLLLLLVLSMHFALASDVDMSELDKAIRSSGSRSIMFRRGNVDAEQISREQSEAEVAERPLAGAYAVIAVLRSARHVVRH